MTTGVLLTPPIIQFFDNAGNPAVGGSVLTQVGSTNTATFQDVGCTVPLPNPIPLNSRGEVSTAFGASAQCFLTPNIVYTFTLYDAGGNQLWVATYVDGVQVEITQASIGAVLWPYDPRFDGALVVNTGWIYGDPRRFGAVGDDATDDTVALNAWASGAGNLTLPKLTFLISDEVTILAHTTITGCEGATIHQSVANKAHFRATSQDYIIIRGVHFYQTTWGASAYVAGVVLDTCRHCQVLENEFEGMQWAGVYGYAPQYCTVRGNYGHDGFPAQAISFTVAPASGATNGTLTAAWTLPTGAYTMQFVETSGGLFEGRQVTLTNGASSATWISALGANCNAAVTVQAATDSSDINIHSSPIASATYNIIDGNFCFSDTFEVGISVQDPYNGVLPTRNIVTNNRIRGQLGYGILVYLPDTGDSYNQIIGNQIENIQGAFGLNVSTGAGIYVTGAGIGGTVVSNNVVRNCCIYTQNSSLAPAAIGITAGVVATNIVPITVTGNSISDMTQYHGILFTGTSTIGTIGNNVIRMPSTNSIGHGIVVTNCDSVNVIGNTIVVLDTSHSMRGILFQGLGGVNCTNCSATGNAITGGNVGQLETFGTSGGLIVGLTVSGNVISGGTSSAVPLNLSSATDVVVTGNFFTTTNNTATINQSSCTNVRYANNRIKGGTVALVIAGTNTGSFVDRSNTGLADANINNSGTGAIVEWSASGALDPSAGTFAVGDTVWRTDAASGARIFAVCTNATGHGTWKVVNLS